MKKIIKPLLITFGIFLLLVALLVVYSLNRRQTYINDFYGYEVEVPAWWMIEEYAEVGAEIYNRGKSVSCTVYYFFDSENSLEDHLEQMLQDETKYTIKKKERTQFGDQEGFYVLATLGKDRVNEYYQTLNNGHGYGLSCSYKNNGTYKVSRGYIAQGVKGFKLPEQPTEPEGLSYQTAVVIIAEDEDEGVPAEYDWLGTNGCPANGGPKEVISQELEFVGGHTYDILTVICNDDTQKNYYFQIDSYYGKWKQ